MGLGERFEQARSLGIAETARRAWRKLFNEVLFTAFERLGMHVIPVHYSSPIPDTRGLRAHRSRWYRQSQLPGIEQGLVAQKEFLLGLAGVRNELQRQFITCRARAALATSWIRGCGSLVSRACASPTPASCLKLSVAIPTPPRS